MTSLQNRYYFPRGSIPNSQKLLGYSNSEPPANQSPQVHISSHETNVSIAMLAQTASPVFNKATALISQPLPLPKKYTAHIKSHCDWVMAVAFSPDGKQIAPASGDTMVRP